MTKLNSCRIRQLLRVATVSLLLIGCGARAAAGTAVLLDLEGALGVATAEYIIDGIEDAEKNGASLVIIRMDTPGGLMEPMRDIVQSILGANIPVATYVSPGGARADSAGTYILLASHIAAMAPTTHLGAATPVSLTGDDPGGGDEQSDGGTEQPADSGEELESQDEETPEDNTVAEEKNPQAPGSAMGRKVLNDAIAYIRGLAEAHGRNADWAEDAVRNAATLTADEALQLNVIDIIANNQAELLLAMHGREVTVNNETVVIDSESLVVERVEPNWRLKFLNVIASPEISVLLLMVGLYGLLLEGYNPGAVIPGVVGVICLLLAGYALQVLPVNYAGLALIVVGMLLIAAEAFVPSFGALGLGGIVAIIFGAIMMFDTGIPGFGISITFVVTLAVLAGGFLFWLVSYLIRLRKRGAVTGTESLLGHTATALESFTGAGRVWLQGEAWQARSSARIEKDELVVVRKIDGLVLEIEPAHAGGGESAELQTQ